MKNFVALCILIFAVGCGSSHPFERGPKSVREGKPFGRSQEPTPENPNPENPSPENPNPVVPQPDEPALSKTFFEANLLPALNRDCAMCHDNPAPNFEAAVTLVVFKKPDESELYLKATGTRHRKVWQKDSAEAAVLVNWINGAN